MKKYSVLIIVLLLVLSVAVSGSVVLAQNDSDSEEASEFGVLIQRIAELEEMSGQQKKDLMVRAIELRYEDGLEVYQISAVLDEYDEYDGIMEQFDEIEDEDNGENGDFADDGNSDFGELILKIAELEGLSDQEKEELIMRAIELRYEDGFEVYRISAVLDEYDDYDGIVEQFDEIEDEDNGENGDLIDSEDSDFGGIILDIVELEDLNNQEKEKIMVRSGELFYEYGVEIQEISAVLDEHDDYDGITEQFDEIVDETEKDENFLEEIEDTLFGEDSMFDANDDDMFD